MRVTADRDVCVGAGQCAMLAPAVFDQGEDGLVTVLTAEPAEADRAAARQAVELCPSWALAVHPDPRDSAAGAD